MYRYGDGTPFPFEENFIDIVVAAVDACASTFAAAAQLDALRAKARDAKREADEEGRRLTMLEQSLAAAASATGPSLGKDATLTQQTAHRALEAARQAIAGSRTQLDKRVAAAAAEPRVDRAMQGAFTSMARFFDHRVLPRTTWDWRWVHGEGGEATSRSGRFQVTYDLIEPPWKAPVRIGALVAGLIAKLPKKRTFGKPTPAKVALDKAGLVSAERTGDRVVLGVRDHAAKPSGGWRIELPSLTAARAACTPVDEHGRSIGAEIELDTDSASALSRLVDAVVLAMETAITRRRTRDIAIAKVGVRSMSDPAEPARAMLDMLAPTIRTLCAKSRVPGELTLKKDIADGRREELFVPRQVIAAKYQGLPADYRKYFDAAGLGGHPTTESDAGEDVDTDRRTERRLPRGSVPPPVPPARPAVQTAGPSAPTLMPAA